MAWFSLVVAIMVLTASLPECTLLQCALITPYQVVSSISYPLNLGYPCFLYWPIGGDRGDCVSHEPQPQEAMNASNPTSTTKTSSGLAHWKMGYIWESQESSASPANPQGWESTAWNSRNVIWPRADQGCMSEPSPDQKTIQLIHRLKNKLSECHFKSLSLCTVWNHELTAAAMVCFSFAGFPSNGNI